MRVYQTARYTTTLRPRQGKLNLDDGRFASMPAVASPQRQ